jgi:hypothetical protein
LQWILGKQGEKVWTGFIWHRIRTSGILLWTWYWAFRFYKRHGMSWLAEWLLASQGLCFTELITVRCVRKLVVVNVLRWWCFLTWYYCSFSEIILHLKENCMGTNEKSLTVNVLAVCPQSWFVIKVHSQF